MDLDTERTGTATPSTTPVGPAVRLPFAAALEVPPRPPLPPTTRVDKAAQTGEQ